MDNWLYQYNDLIETIDGFAKADGDEEFLNAWEYTKKMVTAHGLAIKPAEVSSSEALSIAWSQFEDTFDDEDEQGVLSLAGIIAHLVSTVPVGKNQEFHMALEVGFLRGRGFSKEDAMTQHQEWLRDNPSVFTEENLLFGDDETFTPPKKLNKDELRAQLRLLDGGQDVD